MEQYNEETRLLQGESTVTSLLEVLIRHTYSREQEIKSMKIQGLAMSVKFLGDSDLWNTKESPPNKEHTVESHTFTTKKETQASFTKRQIILAAAH